MLHDKKSASCLDSLLKSVLKRQMPYLIGGTITGTIMAFYYGFLFAIVVNSVIWFVISTLVNKYYWNYTGFKGVPIGIKIYQTYKKEKVF